MLFKTRFTAWTLIPGRWNQQLFRRLEELKPLYFDETDKDKKDKYKQQIEDIIHELTNGTEVFDFEIYFSEVFHRKGGFDSVIANPPYVGEKGNKSVFREIKLGPLREFYQRKSDLFYFFFHLALNVGKTEGSVAFITTNYYPTATKAEKLRTDLKRRSCIVTLINFNEVKIFDSALGQHNMVTLLKKGTNQEAICRTCITNRSGWVSTTVLQNIMNGSDPQSNYWQIPQFSLYDGANSYIRLGGISDNSTDPVQVILKKLQANTIPLGSVCNVNQGILTGVNKITPSHLEEFPRSGFEKGAGVYVISSRERVRLDSDTNIFKPWFKNSDIRRYATVSEREEFVIYATRDIDLPKTSSIYRHFLKFEKIIRARNSDRGEIQAALKQGKWWVIFAARRDMDFDGPKIVCSQRARGNIFGYNEVPWYAGSDVCYIVPRGAATSLKYLLALLNSKLYFLWLYLRGKRKGEMLELCPRPVSEIPIANISPAQQRPLITIVDRILAVKQRDAKADVSALEREIDQLVYSLYELTPEEIDLVEASGAK
jgi:adenine-specific DNA-methyltransferase